MTPENSVIGFLFMVGCTIIAVMRYWIVGHKLDKYLREKHTEKWIEITTVPGLGAGNANSWRGMKFLFSDDYLGDSELLGLKVKLRNSLRYVIGGIGAIIVTFFMMMYAYTK